MKVAVYGTLRKTQSRHNIIKNCKYLGSFESEPIFQMKSIQNSYPAIKKGGNVSVFFEVYDCNKEILTMLDNIEGYFGVDGKHNLYNRKIIHTPYGRAITYIYNNSFSPMHTNIVSGNWVDYINEQKIKDYV